MLVASLKHSSSASSLASAVASQASNPKMITGRRVMSTSDQVATSRKALGPVRVPFMPPAAVTAAAKVAVTQQQQKGTLNLYQYQESLPKLPVPPLEQTIARYLRSVRAVIDASVPTTAPDSAACEAAEVAYARTVDAAKEFTAPGSLGNILQQRLQLRAESVQCKKTSWLHDWWNEYAYLSVRDTLVFNVNYFFHFGLPKLDQPTLRAQLVRAASIAQAAFAFRNLVHTTGNLPPEGLNVASSKSASKKPLCSHQYLHLFNSCRIPVISCDHTHYYPSSPVPTSSKTNENLHMVVIRNSRFFRVDLLDPETCAPKTVERITADLEQVVKIADATTQNGKGGHAPVGVLTTLNRDKWAQVREKMIEKKVNLHSLQKIESALFSLCLDHPSKAYKAPAVSLEDAARIFWHGDGRNRFFDKTLQFVVAADGTSGFNGEHSMIDATPTGRMCEWIVQAVLKTPASSQGATGINGSATELRFELSENENKEIRLAELEFERLCAKHDVKVLRYQKYGKNVIKKHGVSPDAWVQLAMQLAYARVHNGVNSPVYETAQTRKFAFGRTETGRTLSSESLRFVRAMIAAHDNGASKAVDAETCAQLAQLIRAAAEAHGEYMRAAGNAHGVDRHLMGLRLLVSAKDGEKEPALFRDPSFDASRTWRMSTSQLSSEVFAGYGWGQVVPDGYGLPYMIQNAAIQVCIASMHLRNAEMRDHIARALDEMHAVIDASQASAASKPQSKL